MVVKFSIRPITAAVSAQQDRGQRPRGADDPRPQDQRDGREQGATPRRFVVKPTLTPSSEAGPSSELPAARCDAGEAEERRV